MTDPSFYGIFQEMRGITKLILLVGINALALYLVSHYVPGVSVPADIPSLLMAAGILTALNVTLKPLLDALLAPINWITLGFTSFLISGLMISLLDKISDKVTINGPVPLLLCTVVIGLTNAICSQLLFLKS